VTYLAAVLGGYLVGSIPSGYWIVRLTRGVDVRRVGSKSIGATNVWRAFGWKYGVPTIVLDVAKGLVPALAARLLVDDLAGVLAGGAAMVGHWRPLYLRFEKGGKLVATTGGVLLGLAPWVALFALGAWGATFLVARYVSVASMTAAVAVPVFAVVLDQSWPIVVLTFAGGIAVLLLHKDNVRRLLARREPRVQLGAMFRR
jgi:acyl phosphate:glycerol-3-phosphate acyltransferase